MERSRPKAAAQILVSLFVHTLYLSRLLSAVITPLSFGIFTFPAGSGTPPAFKNFSLER